MTGPINDAAEFLRDQLRDWAPVTARRLFSGWGIYNGPVMFGLVVRDTIYFRVDDGNRPDYVAAAAAPFLHAARRRATSRAEDFATDPKPGQSQVTNGKAVEMSYYEVPPDVLEDVEELALWATKAHAAARRVVAKKPKPRPSQKIVKPAVTPKNKKATIKPGGK